MQIVINLGLKSIRAIAFNASNKVIASCSRPVMTFTSYEIVEQETIEWILKLEEILIELSGIIQLNEIQTLTCTTSSSCIVGVDANFNAMTKVLMVSDKRASAESRLLTQFINANKINCSAPSSGLLAKAFWFKNNQISTFEKVKYWLGAGEFLSYFFTKQFFTDSLSASKYGHDGFEYSAPILELAGLSSEMLPKVQKVCSTFDLEKTVIRKFGFSKKTKFVLSTYDAICAVVGSAKGDTNTLCDVSGTVTSVRIIKNNAIGSGNPTLLSQKLDYFDNFIIGSSNNLGGGIVEWFKQSFYSEYTKDVYSMMENLAISSNPGSNGLIFLPYLLGERAPFKSDFAKGVFWGINRNTNHSDFSRAVFESTAFVSYNLINSIKNTGLYFDKLSVSGGLARFQLISQLKSDVSGLPVYVAENFESTSIGALAFSLISLGHFNNILEASSELVGISKVIEPNLSTQQLYKSLYDYFSDLSIKLNDNFFEYSKIVNEINKNQKSSLNNL